MNQGILRYANIASDGRFTLSRQAGVTPGQITANFIMGASLPAYGDVVVEFGGQSIRLPNCRLRRKVIDSGGSQGRMQQVIFEDRRWRWAFAGPLYGYYNHYEKGIKVTTSTNILSCRALATVILDWLGERRFDVMALPDDFFPIVEWDGENAAAALEALVDEVGCQVVLKWDDTVRIVQRGVGIAAPDDDRVMDYTVAYEPPVIPEYLIVESGRTLFQADLPLEPVGLEPDSHEIRHIDDLSYKPAGGWEAEPPGLFYGVTDVKLRDLAQSCVWKMFRPRLPAEVAINGLLWTQNIAAIIESDERWRILPFESQQLEIYRDTRNDRPLDAQIVGYFCDQHQGNKNNTTLVILPAHDTNMLRGMQLADSRELIYTGYGRNGEMPFAIDVEQGIVRTFEPLYLLSKDLDGNTTGVSAPLVNLRTAFVVRDPAVRAPYRQQYIFNVGGQPGLVQTLRVNELLYEFGQPGIEANWNPVGPADFAQQCYFYALRYLNQFYDGPSATIPMKGFAFDIDVDGAVRSVTFSRDDAGRATTAIEWHTERPEIRPTYKELFDRRTVNQVVKKFRDANAAGARGRGRRNLGAGFQQGQPSFGS